jgi:hypothetical protein
LHKRIQQTLASIFCFLLLTQSALAMACHSFGDVHVICKEGHVAVVLIDRETQSEVSQEEEDCCASMVVSAGRDHATIGFEAIAIIRSMSPEIVATNPLAHRTAKPREPPSNILF